MKKKAAVLTNLIFILPLSFSCLLEPYEYRDCAEYSSAHFRLHYRESEYTLPEIEAFARKKEQLLEHINQTLDCRFDKTVETYLTPIGSYAFANRMGQTYECRSYLYSDNGHELAHIVTFDQLGYSDNDFLCEGLAEAASVDSEGVTVIERFVNAFRNNIYYSLWHQKEHPSISSQILDNSFGGDPLYDYPQAGAFIRYLMMHWGTDKVKSLYVASITRSSGELAGSFTNIMGCTLFGAESLFVERYLEPDSQKIVPVKMYPARTQ